MAGRVRGQGRIGLSTNVLLVGLIFSGLGFGIGADLMEGSGAAFVFLMAGWVLGLCLHEFGHAEAARLCGLPAAGSLSLDPLRAPNPLATMLLPTVFTILGGLGFPGGVGASPEGVSSPARRSMIAAAGPAMSLAFLVALVVLYTLASPAAETLRAALAVSVLFQGTALILGLMPVPGLDGYDIVRPWISGPATARAGTAASRPSGIWTWADRMVRHSSLVLLGIFLVSGAFTRPLFRASLRLTAGLGIDLADVITGYRLVRLW